MLSNNNNKKAEETKNIWEAPKLEIIDKNITEAGGPGVTDLGILS